MTDTHCSHNSRLMNAIAKAQGSLQGPPAKPAVRACNAHMGLRHHQRAGREVGVVTCHHRMPAARWERAIHGMCATCMHSCTYIQNSWPLRVFFSPAQCAHTASCGANLLLCTHIRRNVWRLPCSCRRRHQRSTKLCSLLRRRAADSRRPRAMRAAAAAVSSCSLRCLCPSRMRCHTADT